MGIPKWRFAGAVGVAILSCFIGRPRHADAQVSIGFEPPTYATGPLIGQDGWVKNAYYGTLNGDVNVSATSPLSGTRSLSYSQTVAGAGFSDVSKPGVILVSPGVQGTDLTLSYVIKATSNGQGSPNGGIFLGNGAVGGASPIFARINGGVVEVGASGGITPINSFFFSEGERLKMTYEVDFDTSTMNFIVENLDFGDLFSQNFPFFAPYGPPTGPNGEFNVDVGAFLRGGNVQIDDITLAAGVGPLVTDFTWVGTGSGNWNQASNWDPPGSPGSVPGRQSATLGAAAGPTTIYSNAKRILNSLEINSANSYFLTGTGSLGFQTDTSGVTPVAPTLHVFAGTHQIQLPVELVNNTTITVNAGAALDLNNQVNLAGRTLTTTGTVRLNHSTIGGGAVVSLGALAVDGDVSIGGDLVSSGALLVSVDGSGADSFHVAGNASLSGIVDVDWSPASVSAGTLTILTAGGSLDASGLSLAPEDARAFALGTEGNSLTLTFLGAAVPEPTTIGLLAIGLVGMLVRRERRGIHRRRTALAAAVGGARMDRDRRRLARMAPAVVGGAVLLAAQSASAVSFTFENPPYTPGNLLGQQGWQTGAYILADPFFGGEVNGTVEVSTSGPLVGAQSVRYTQTIDPASAGATGGSDATRPFSVFGVEDGTDAVDITGSFRVKADANSLAVGQMGFFIGMGGRSPMFIQVANVSSTGGTGDIIVGHDLSVPTVGSYVPNNVYEMSFGVDLDGQNYEAFARNVTAGTAAVQLVGPGPGGRFPFFGGAIGDDGDGQTYTFDATMILRSGTGQFDNITVVGDDFVQAVWNGGSGNWSQNPAWIPHMIPNAAAGANGQIAIFGDRITTPQTVFTDSTQTVNGLRFDNANKYVIGGAGAVALKANTIGGTVNPTINVVSGAHELQVAVNVLDNTAVTVAAGAQLDFNNNVSLGGKTLTTSGAVNLNVGVTGGGTISNSGTLGTAGTTPIAANLTSTGALQINLGPANKDFFNITGSATLSGVLDVVLEAGFVPVGSYTVLTASGGLNAAGLALDASDTSSFTLGVSGNSLVLTVGGTTSLPGDFNHDNKVDHLDLAKWKNDFGAGAGSDADNDNDSDGADFLIWQRNLGQTAATPAAGAVPEPAALGLCAISLAALVARKRSARGR